MRPFSERRRENIALQVAGTASTIVATLAIGLVLHLTVISQLQYERNQQTRLADFRAELALATAPVGQYRVQYDDSGRPKPPELVKPGSAVAVLDINKIGLHTLVVEGTSGDDLRYGPGHRRDTPLPGQAGTSVIMGRHAAYGGPFRDLDLLMPGDDIKVTTGQGVQEYVVSGLRSPGDPEPAPPTTGRLVLITADGREFVPHDARYVDADLRSAVQPAPARKFGAAQLPEQEEMMGTDPGGWTVLMLWTQALLVCAVALTYVRGRLSGWHAWIIGAPVLAAIGLAAADQAARLLPNLL